MFHLLAHHSDLGINAADATINAVADTIFMDRSNGFIYTEDWGMVSAFATAVSLLRVRSNVPKLNAINRHQIFPINRSLTVPSPFNIQDLRSEPLWLPQNEVFTWQGSNNLAAATEQTRVFQAIVPTNWTRELPPHLQRLNVRFTASAVGILDSWSTDVALTFPDQDLRGGVYSMIGCQVFDAGVQAFRFIFPRQKMTQGRQLRPGGIALEAINNIPHAMFSAGLGEWGRFHTFEFPRIQIFANAAGASTQEGRMDVLYLGDDEALLNDTM